MKSTLRLSAYIRNGSFFYSDTDFREKLDEFKFLNEGFGFDVIFESHSDPVHWQFKYLYGYVYFAIAQGMGIPIIAKEGKDNRIDAGIDEVDRICKERFLFLSVISESEVPRKWRGRCEKFYVDYVNPETGEIIKKIYGVIPSKTRVGYEGLADYIKQCEMIRDGLTDWGYADPKEMTKCRDRAFKQEQKRGKL